MPRLTDTTPEAERVLTAVYRRMSPERRWQLMVEMVGQGRMLHAVGLRHRRPGVTPSDILDDWNSLVYGVVPGPRIRVEDDAVFSPNEVHRVVGDVVGALETMGIDYALGGSMASAVHGIARFTADADLTVSPFPGREEEFAGHFGDAYFVSVDAIRAAIRDRASFNLINTEVGFKADLFIMKDRRFDASVMARRIRGAPLGPDAGTFDLVSAEDIVLHKLEWYRLGGETSDRQWNDVLGVLRVQGEQLDGAYLDHWAAELGVRDLLEAIRAEADS